VARVRKRTDRSELPLSLSVEGYKAIRGRTSIDIKPLTVISGANSSGKSSFVQPFLMMKQTLDSAFDPGPLLLYGPNVKVTEYSQILSRGKARTDVVDHFTAGMTLGDDVREVRFVARQEGVSIASDTSHLDGARTVLSEPLTKKGIERLREVHASTAERYWGYLRPRAGDRPLTEDRWQFDVYRNRCFLEATLVITLDDENVFPILLSNEVDDDRWVRLLRGIIHVPGLRGNPERAYSRSAVGTTYPGTFETYVASIVYEWSAKDPARVELLSNQLRSLGLTWKLVAQKVDDASVRLMVGRTQQPQQGGAQDLVSVADVGFGVSQTLPVLVALLAANPGQIVYIEQPEIHLHPRAQLALAQALVAAANRGVYVIAETHSSLLIRGIQTEIANGNLSADALSLNWFSRDPITGFQKIEVAEVDQVGRFGEWPVDFDEISREADWQYLEAVASADQEHER
jgi:predicted ATPase